MSKSKLTPKQHKFAELVAGGDTLSDSYRGAYNAANMQAASIHVQSCRLAVDPKVALRIEQEQGRRARNKHVVELSTRAKVLAKLEELMEDKAQNIQLGAAIALGKTIGLFTDVVQEKKDTKTLEEIDTEIAQRIAEIEAKMKVKH